jgi:hypothetical protein
MLNAECPPSLAAISRAMADKLNAEACQLEAEAEAGSRKLIDAHRHHFPPR